jgi:hypothetical protein
VRSYINVQELHGQLPLFADVHQWAVTEFRGHQVYELTDRVIDHITWDDLDADEVCDECGLPCTSSKECNENGGLP